MLESLGQTDLGKSMLSKVAGSEGKSSIKDQ
jgi:hypothetical protein